MLTKLPRTALRLASAFAVVLTLFGAAMAFTIHALGRLDTADSEVADVDEAKHSAHAVGALVREQYIHQAHTIIEWNYSHVDHYDDVARELRAKATHLRSLMPDQRTRELAGEIEQLAGQIDRDFRRLMLPIVGRGERGSAVPLHTQTERLVTRTVRLNEELSTQLERRSADARSAQAVLRKRMRVAIILCFLLALAAAAVIGIAITRSVTRRLSSVRRGAAWLAEGDLSTRIEALGQDEFAELGQAFNRMAKALEGHQAKMMQAQKLASIGQVAAGVAHEINNPLGVILGYTKLMARDAEDAKLRETLSIIEDETRQCQRIVQGLLDLARPPRPPSSRVDLTAVVRHATDQLEEVGKLDGIRITVSDDETPAWVVGDAQQLRQVIANLLQNAAEATRGAGERIVISIERRGQSVELSIADSGSGIPESVLPHLFEPFFTTKARGTGLGLAIAQAIVHAHGGELLLRSKADEGTVATLRLPAAEARRPEAAE